MVEFYDHPDGTLRMRATAGGHGGGATSTFDGIATAADIAAHPNAHHVYLAPKLHAEALAREEAAKRAEEARRVREAEARAVEMQKAAEAKQREEAEAEAKRREAATRAAQTQAPQAWSFPAPLAPDA